MKLTYPPLLAAHNIGFLQHMLFGLISIFVSVKVLYFYQDLEQKSTKQKSCGKSFKIVLVLAYGRMLRKLQLTILRENCVLHQWLKKCLALYHSSYFIKQLPNSFPCRIASYPCT